MAIVDGQEVKVGDWVGFKSDIEQTGIITGIRKMTFGRIEFIVENSGGFEGGYIGGQTVTRVDAADCWII